VTQSGRDSLSADRQAAGGTIYVYALANLVNEEIYVGISRDVAVRLPQSISG